MRTSPRRYLSLTVPAEGRSLALASEVPGAKGVRAEDAHVIAALEGRGVGHGTPAHAAAHVPHGIVLMLFKPTMKVRKNGGGLVNPSRKKGGGHHGHTCTGQDAFHYIDGAG